MNQLRGILLGFVLISGSVFTPYSFAETTDYSDGPYSSFFKLLQYLFSSGDVTVITNSNSILDFNKAVIILTSSTANSTEDDDFDDFYHGIVSVSSETSTVGKVTLCHVSHDKDHSITVANPSVSAHLAHGDYLGTCDSDDSDDLLDFDTAQVITSSNTGVTQLYDKILYLKSNPSISLESLKDHISSVADLSEFLVDADKQDRKEFKKLFHDYKEIVKQLIKKADKQSKYVIENILDQTEDAFKVRNHEKEYKDHNEKESEHKDKEKHKEKESKHKDD